MKKTVCLFLLLFGLNNCSEAFADSNNNTIELNESTIIKNDLNLKKEINDTISFIQPYIFKDTNGTLKFKKMDSNIYNNYNIKNLNNYLSIMNKEVLEGKMTVTNNFDYVPVHTNFLAEEEDQDWTFHWYGMDASLNNQNTKEFINNCTLVVSGASTSAAVFPQFAPFSLVTSAYFGVLANRASNSNQGNGIYIAIAWNAMFYTSPL